jgi:hypothetical protein
MQTPIPVRFEQVFPAGAYLTTNVKPVMVFKDGKSTGVQDKDEASGDLKWQVTVMDADPNVEGPSKSVKVKILSPVQPVPPPELPGLPFRPVEFEQVFAQPYIVEVMQGRHKVAYSLTVRGMVPPMTAVQVAEKSNAGPNTGSK